jgi:hypothetical protein
LSALSDTLLKPFETTARRETSANGLALTTHANSGSKTSMNILNRRVGPKKMENKKKQKRTGIAFHSSRTFEMRELK